MRAAFLIAALSVGLFACSSNPPKTDRAPNQEAHEHAKPQPTPEFVAAESVPRQHSFIFPDPKGHFGYHVSQFHANHQHQFIVKGKIVPSSKESLFRGRAANGYFSVTSDKPQFLLSELISGKRTQFNANVYDGLIITRPQKIVDSNVKYVIQERLFENTMYANDQRITNSVYIVFGSYGAPKKTYYLAHLIKAANNFEQILVADFEKDLVIPNGALMALGQEDHIPLAEGDYEGQIDGQTVKFKVKRQVYFDKRSAEGYPEHGPAGAPASEYQ